MIQHCLFRDTSLTQSCAIPYSSMQVKSSYTLMGVFITDAGRYKCSANSEAVSNPVLSDYAQLLIIRKLFLEVT